MREAIQTQIPNVYRFALRLTRGNVHQAEDLTQETILKALTQSKALRDAATIRVWMLRIASNCWIDQVRKANRNCDALAAMELLAKTESPAADTQILLEEELRSRLSQLDRLPPRQRSVLYLHACEELSIQEIGAILQISREAVKASLCVARARMRRHLTSERLQESESHDQHASRYQ